MRTPPLLATVALLVIHAAAGAQQARPDDVATIDGILRGDYEVVSGPTGESSDVTVRSADGGPVPCQWASVRTEYMPTMPPRVGAPSPSRSTITPVALTFLPIMASGHAESFSM